MRPYLALLSARFRLLLQYRMAAFAGAGTQLFWGLIRTMIFDAFYASTSAPQPINRTEIVSYIWLGQALLGMLPWDVDTDIRTMVRTGTVAYELLRPLDLYNSWYMRALAQRTAPTLLRSIPLFIVAGLFFGLKPPPTPYAAGAWLLCTLAALALACAISSMMNVTMLFTVSGDGINRFLSPMVYTLSGMLIPIPLLPVWLVPLVNFLPFRGLIDTPFRAYLGQLGPNELAAALCHQATWTGLLILAGRLLLAQCARRMVVQGG